jgi:hypothetical protein
MQAKCFGQCHLLFYSEVEPWLTKPYEEGQPGACINITEGIMDLYKDEKINIQWNRDICKLRQSCNMLPAP